MAKISQEKPKHQGIHSLHGVSEDAPSAENSFLPPPFQLKAGKYAKTIEKEQNDQTPLGRLDEVLSYWNVPEEEVISLMGQLSRVEALSMFLNPSYKRRAVHTLTDSEMQDAMLAVNGFLHFKLEWVLSEGTKIFDAISLIQVASQWEKNAVGSNSGLRRSFVRKCTNETMIEVVNALNLDLETRREWLNAEGVKFYNIIESSGFKREVDGAILNPILYKKMRALCHHLIDYNLVHGDIMFNYGARSAKDAHRMSTAYYIRKGDIPLDNLKALKDGVDLDGNKWYDKSWNKDQVVANAKSIWSGARANEGYQKGSLSRLPNIDSVKRSNHCYGEAIDANVRWRFADPWAAEANALVTQFGLKRSESDEPWHYELLK